MALTIGLPKTDVVRQLVRVIIKTLFALLGAPNADAVAHKPFHNKGSFIRDTAYPVEHEHQQNVKLFLFGILLDKLYLVPVFRPYLVAGNALLLQFAYNRPAHRFTVFPAALSLHGNVCLVVVSLVELFIGGNAVKA